MKAEGALSPRLLALALGLALTPFAFLHPVKVSGRSMEPLVRDGDLRWVLRAWCAGPPRAGQIWLVAAPGGPAVKRLVALPGSRVELKDGDLWVDGQYRDEPYVTHPDRATLGPWATGAGAFLLGDNRGESHDCRAWGPLPLTSLEGRLLAP